MRTKTLLLTAALSAAGIATSMAQVYSVNAVGYVNTPILPGYNLISNPLDNKAGNTIQNLFSSLPDGSVVYPFKNGAFLPPATADAGDLTPASAGAVVINPGEGAFVRNKGTTTITVTFIGEVPQGVLDFTIPKGFSILASKVPQAGTAATLGLVGKDGDVVYQFNETTQKYENPSISDTGVWDPPLKNLDVGHSFFFKSLNGSTWVRTFSVNS